MKIINRRQFLQLLGYGAASIAGSKFLSACSSFSSQSPTSVYQGDPDVEIRLTAQPGEQQIFSSPATKVWCYKGEVIKGSGESLLTIPNSYLGPIFNLKKGTKLRVHFINEIPQETIVHWHGLHVPENADGHPRFAVEQGQTYVYNYQVLDRAGSYWYHPHPHGITGPQVYQGLAGMFLVHDEEEESLSLPRGDYDLPIVIQDRVFDGDNQFVYEPAVFGMFGDQILVNGQPEYNLSVDRGVYRLRLLNGSNARIYKLAWEDGAPLQVIGTDGGLLEEPITRDYITMAPAQRLDLWVDFRNWEPGSTPKLVNLPSEVIGGGETFTIFSASIKETEGESLELPQAFPSHEALDPAQAVNADSPRLFELGMEMGMQWTINGRTFEMTDVARDERVNLGDVEIWEFYNTGGIGMGGRGMMGGMAQAHPMHIHGLQFKILERQVDPGFEDLHQSVSGGFVDEGWHDTVLVLPGERVRVLMEFTDFTGLYMYHCHNLEHEDMGMMRNYRVDS